MKIAIFLFDTEINQILLANSPEWCPFSWSAVGWHCGA